MTTKTADNPQSDAGKKAYEEEKKASDKSKAEYVRMSKGKPTPTQEENDLAACGVHVLEHEPDGSDPDPNSPEAKESKQVEAERSQQKPANYQTRHQTPSRSTE